MSIEEFEKIENQNQRMVEPIFLHNRVDDFIRWYYKNMIKGKGYSPSKENNMIKEIVDLMEKIAVWYELRYPDYEINRMFPCIGQEDINSKDIMFQKNPYLEDLSENDSIKQIDWSRFYNKEVFINSLPWEEKAYFMMPNKRTVLCLDNEKRKVYFYLNEEDIIEKVENITEYTSTSVREEELKGLHIKEAIELLKEKNIELPKDNELEKRIKEIENWNYQKEGLLNSAMYRIMDRGGARIGPRRAFLFAKEFKRNIDIPMIYAVDPTDPGLEFFANEYLESGGSKDIECYVGYYGCLKHDKIPTTTVGDVIQAGNNDSLQQNNPKKKNYIKD